MYKNLMEVQWVISLGKPIEVVDMFLESYMQGVEYDKWAEGKDLTETTTVVVGQDADGNDITEDQLVNVYSHIDVLAQMAQWKLTNYAELRKPHYPPMAEFIDAHVKNDAVALDAYTQACLAVKLMFPKPTL